MSKRVTIVLAAILFAACTGDKEPVPDTVEQPKVEQPTPIKRVPTRAVMMSWACPDRPERPTPVRCWTPDGVDSAHEDCVDRKRMNDCSFQDINERGTVDQLCPACIVGCKSKLPAKYEADRADYEAKREKCPQGWHKAGGDCLCFTDHEVDPEDTLDMANVDLARKKILLRCQKERGIVTRWISANSEVPRDCVAVTDPVYKPRSVKGVWTAFDHEMQAKCAPYPIRPGNHGHCPACTQWAAGCPPCRLLAERYGENWKGHEDECDAKETMP